MLKNREKFLIRTVGDKFYLLYLDKTTKYNAPMELNGTGEFIARKLIEGLSVVQVAELIASEFEVDAKEVVADIWDFVNSMPEYFKVED